LEYATKHKTILASNKIVAISQSTKNDIIKIIGLQEEKIDVIHLASSLRYNPEKDQNTWRDYIFYVGDRGGYKNFIPFVKSISHLLKKYKLSLICAGANQFTWKERFLIYQLGISKFVKHIPIQGESHLASLYKHALFFVFPSLYEGFGIPLLESMNIGCPVVCSNTSSFPEVAGDAALYFDSNAVDSISSAIQRMIESDSLRKELSEKGKIQSQKFSWEKTSQKHLELYKKLS
jgi:glycosyltransferase involved in cell wall biosynthesis